ncbi:hypothetical protein AKJ52_02125 [candidate division MSBL1 archaeon SCGC-AAA382C18]|uniref:Transposase DDE domain-containing protein n=1 Tax=candidate division MSBL1 archaeon SCGC-AAA382C18 TaxID=1698281 RepID=A0A133VJ98_9EURY|nr:hypothetical protein AKJ52_02125 [candidate division MSBL1 archaeon SCGC-AAA382C18]
MEEPNEGKVRAPYKFPESYVQFAVLCYEFFSLLYRLHEDALRKLGELQPELKASDYMKLWHRFKGLEFKIPETEDKDVAAVDSAIVKVTDRGEWLRKTNRR